MKIKIPVFWKKGFWDDFSKAVERGKNSKVVKDSVKSIAKAAKSVEKKAGKKKKNLPQLISGLVAAGMMGLVMNGVASAVFSQLETSTNVTGTPLTEIQPMVHISFTLIPIIMILGVIFNYFND